MTARVVLAPQAPDWSYDFTARALVRHLGERYDFAVAYGSEAVSLAERADVVVDFWWRGHLEQHLGRRVLKQVSSHRWAQRAYGRHTPRTVTRKHLMRAGGVVVPSMRLHALFEPELTRDVWVTIAPKGFEPDAFFCGDDRRGDLHVGWAGNRRHPDKRVALLREAWPDLVVTDRVPYGDMPRWYNSVDVITCASDAEGDPRPLIEGMACGCFPVTVDVGIVPELVHHGVNGLIVERSADAFADALAWCRENLAYVREAGRRNAEAMLRTRTWAACMPAWTEAIESTLARATWAA